MISRIELGKRILEERPESRDEWITDQSLEGVKLGNFAWKRQRYFVMRMIPTFAKYSYKAASETLEEYLQDGVKFTFNTDHSSMSLPAKTYENKHTWTVELMNMCGWNDQHSDKGMIPAIDLTITRINRRDLEHNLKSRKLDMTSSYIKEKKRNTYIPCIISGIVEASTPEDQPDTKAFEERKRQIGGNVKLDSSVGTSDVLDSVTPKGNIVSKTCERTEGFINGPVLYKVLPLEVDPTGCIEAKEDSKGFIENKVVADSASGNFSSTIPDPTLKESFNDIEKHLQPVIEDQSVADAFKSISNEDIHYLCRLFERVQDCPDDVEEPDKMSSECRTILLFAKFQPKEPGKLVLKERFQEGNSFTSCYYLAAVLAEVPTSVRQLFNQTTVNLFPLLKDILLERPRKDIEINDDILKCNEAKALLEMLDICTKGSTVDAAPASQALLVNAVWIAMLYGWHSRKEQQ